MGDPFDLGAGWLQEHLLIPLLYALGLMQWEDVSYGWALFAVYGACQVAITFAVCVPLERWRPVERWPDARAVTVDVLYTIISRVGASGSKTQRSVMSLVGPLVFKPSRVRCSPPSPCPMEVMKSSLPTKFRFDWLMMMKISPQQVPISGAPPPPGRRVRGLP